MKHRLTSVLWIALALLSLAGCAAQTAAVPPPPATPGSPPSPPPAANTPALPNTPAPTATVTRSPIPTPDVAATQTAIVEAELAHIAATQQAIVAALRTSVPPQTYASYLSPDGQWRADVVIHPCTHIVGSESEGENAYEQLLLVSREDGASIVAAEQFRYCQGLGAYGLDGIAWAPSSRFFYYTDSREGSPDGGSIGWNPALYRFDIRTRQSELLGGGGLSPDERKAAALGFRCDERGCTPTGFKVWDLDGQVLTSQPPEVPAGGYWYGEFAWSPNSQAVALLETICASPADCSSAISLIDLAADEQQVVLADHSPYFLEVNWQSTDRLALVDENYRTWFFTLSTQELEEQP